jgi:hypothetical protein
MTTTVTIATPPKTVGESDVELVDEDVVVDGCAVVVAVVVMVVVLGFVDEDVDSIVELLLVVVVAALSCIVSVSGLKRVEPSVAV